MTKRKITNNDQQSTTKNKTKDRETQNPLKTGGELGCSWWVSSYCLNRGTCRVILLTNPNEW